MIGPEKLAPLSQPIKYKTKTNPNLVTRVFARFRVDSLQFLKVSQSKSDTQSKSALNHMKVSRFHCCFVVSFRVSGGSFLSQGISIYKRSFTNERCEVLLEKVVEELRQTDAVET